VRVANWVLIGALAFASPALAAKAPTITSISILAELSTPLPYPYDENADANKAVDAALAKAKAEHKRAFIDLGGNWCGDCRVLAGLMELPEVKAFVNAHYIFVAVDVGRFNKNLQIPARWNMVQVVDAGHTGALEDSRRMDPQSIMNWIAEWAN
jgi:thiol-disulfide isomerase/thioredoxin